MLQPGVPLCIEIKNAIDVEPLSLRNYHTALARLELGMKISWILDGYWGKDERGHLRRLAPLANRGRLVFDPTPLNVCIDLREMKLDEVRDLHHMLIGSRLASGQYVLR